MKDEYLRDHAIEPEFVERKDSIKTHKDRISQKRKKLKKQFSFDASKDVENGELSEIAFPKPLNSIEYSVYEFSSVIILKLRERSVFLCGLQLRSLILSRFLEVKCRYAPRCRCNFALSEVIQKHLATCQAPDRLMNPRDCDCP